MIKFENGLLVSCPFPFVIELIPKANKTSRSQLYLIPESITIHNFGDDNKPTAEQVSDWIDKAYNRYSSWQFTIGHHDGILKIIQKLPIDEVAWAAGDGYKGPGNRTSIHIECEEVDEAEDLMIEFVKMLLMCLKVTKVVPHKHWTGKNCPRIILPHWKEFMRKVNGEEMTKREIQAGLKQLGYYNGPIDGDIGPNSIKAVKAFQSDRGLVADGSPGPSTQRELQKALDTSLVLTVEDRLNILETKVYQLEKKL